MSARTLLAVEDLAKVYAARGWLGLRRGAPVRAVDGVSFTIDEGSTLALVGESGAGKSTVARALAGLVAPTRGRAWWTPREGGARVDLLALRARERRRLAREIQIVFQDPWSSLDPRRTIGESVEEALRAHAIVPLAQRAARVAELLGEVGLAPELAARAPHALSGGQRQRVAIARALAVEPRLLLCDEPLASLDVSVQAQILGLLGELRARRGLALLFVSHDLVVVRHFAERIAVMLDGRIVEAGDTDAVLAAPRERYTAELLAAAADPLHRPERAPSQKSTIGTA